MGDLAILNGKPAPYRRDLRGDDLAYELELLLARLEPGDRLTIDRKALRKLGASLDNVAAPVYPHRRWVEELTNSLCVERLR